MGSGLTPEEEQALAVRAEIEALADGLIPAAIAEAKPAAAAIKANLISELVSAREARAKCKPGSQQPAQHAPPRSRSERGGGARKDTAPPGGALP